MRADLSEFGAGEVVSRNEKNFREEVIRRLQDKLNTAIEEVVSDVSEELNERARTRQSRLSNKRAQEESTIAPKRYINPFAQDV